jgi:hypothetical protein
MEMVGSFLNGKYLVIILIQEEDDSDIILKSYDVGLGKGFHRRHVRLGGLKSP